VTSTVLSVPAPRPAAVVNQPPDTQHHGQCTKCLRAISLTAAGLVRSHGLNCLASAQPLDDRPISRVPTLRQTCTSQSAVAFGVLDSETNVASSTTTRSSADIVELLSLCRWRVLKRTDSGGRQLLADILHQVVVDPDSVDKWVDLLSFSFTCFGVPGQRGG